jgi:hypothetical protein
MLGNEYGASGRKTVYEKLLAAKRRILTAFHIRFHKILNGNRERNLVLKARYLAGETLSALAREFGLSPQRVFQIISSSN